MNEFDRIIGKRLQTIVHHVEIFDSNMIDDSIGLLFNDNHNLSIFNRFYLSGVDNLREFISEIVIATQYTKSTATFEFSNNKKIVVSLKVGDCDWLDIMSLDYNGQSVYWQIGTE